MSPGKTSQAKRKSVWRHNQRNDDLNAIGALAPAVAELALPFYQRLFAGDGPKPSLALAHASTDLQKDYQASIIREGLTITAGRSESEYGSKDEATASAQCAEGLRRSLLADIGVGTVDQALLAALPVKFQSLRLTALSDRILVDEAHSYDAYTTRLLKQLLPFQAALGGSAIILSATLTTRTKDELLTAFAAGAGWLNPHWCEKAESRTDAFPLASLLGALEASGSCARSARRPCSRNSFRAT